MNRIICAATILSVFAAARAAVTIDVMFAYDRSAARWLAANDTDGNELARHVVEEMNAVLPATHLDDYFSFHLVGVMASAAEAEGAEGWDRLENTVVSVASATRGTASGAWTDIHAARDAAKADIVVVLVDSGEAYGNGGMAGVSWSLGMGTLSDPPKFAPWAYSVCNVQVVVDNVYIVAHEVGHVMGAGHSDLLIGEPGPQLYPYSSAYHFVDSEGVKRHTIMGYYYTSPFDSGYSLYPAFSSSEFLTPEGDPLGDATHDNTRTLRETCVAVSQFRISGDEGTAPVAAFTEQVVASCKVVSPDGGIAGIAQITVAKTDKKGKSRVSAAFYGLDGVKKAAKAVKAAVSLSDGMAKVRDVTLAVKGEAAPLVVTVGVDGSVTGTFGARGVERAESVAALVPAARFSVSGMPASINGMEVLNKVDAGGISYHLLPDGAGVGFSVVGAKWVFAKAAGVKYAKSKATEQKELLVDLGKDGSRTNLCGLKLSVNAKTGVFKGTFTVYAEAGTSERPRLKKLRFKVSGVVVNGAGFGQAVCGGITVEAAIRL